MDYKIGVADVSKGEVESVNRRFLPLNVLMELSPDKRSCEHCGKSLPKSDMVAVAFLKGGASRIICQECAKMFIEGGAENISPAINGE